MEIREERSIGHRPRRAAENEMARAKEREEGSPGSCVE
jgi:hypothetical protein